MISEENFVIYGKEMPLVEELRKMKTWGNTLQQTKAVRHMLHLHRLSIVRAPGLNRPDLNVAALYARNMFANIDQIKDARVLRGLFEPLGDVLFKNVKVRKPNLPAARMTVVVR